MGLENCDVVDAVGTDTSDGKVVLSILDSWDWTDERTHLERLQAKLNAYFSFVDSRQIYDDYPDAKGRGLVIDVVARFPIPESATEFLNSAASVALTVGAELTYRHVK
jgi:hypothetical protein